MSGIVEFFRTASWLNRERVIAYCRIALITYVACLAYVMLSSSKGVDIWGRPLGDNFLGFWTAGSLALSGTASAAYDASRHIAEQAVVIPGAARSYYPWIYPPVFLLPMALLALLPYGWSLLAWLAATATAYVACLRRIVPDRHTAVVALACPVAFDNALTGQNGFLSAAIFGAGLTLLGTSPIIAGLCLSAMSYKPQLALLLPIALVAGGHWRALVAATAGAAMLLGLSTFAFGPDIWPAFQESRRVTQGLLEGSHGVFLGKVGVFTAVRLLEGDLHLAWLVQGLVTVAMAIATTWTWRSPAPLHLKCALLVAATPLATPWVNIYDLLILAVPVAWLLREGLERGFLAWERIMLAAVAIVPVLSIGFAAASRVQIVPFMELAFVLLILRRLRCAAIATP